MAKLLPVNCFDLVIFGGTGDLARRKLLPALYHRDRDCQLSDDSRIIAASRSELSHEAYVNLVREALQKHLDQGEFSDDVWARFSRRLSYYPVDALDASTWDDLHGALTAVDPSRTRAFYLATSPNLFGPIAAGIGARGLVHEHARIVLEKPMGHDLASALRINDEVGAVFTEDQVYRIDHYLGKETVQNLLALRFGNSLFEPIWNRGFVEHVQITVSENIGVGSRGDFYDQTGALRDMVQNHILQLLCLVAMEPPTSLDHNEVRDEKLKVLRALRPITAADVKRKTVRGQYAAGSVDGESVPSYLDELGENSESNTETFVALKVEIDNWRWSNTPFYIRTGKRLAARQSEIRIQFAPVAHSIFEQDATELVPNHLTIRLQPDEGVHLGTMVKEPGPGGFKLRPVSLNLSFGETFAVRYPDAYERLLMEVLRGNPALFMRRDEVEAAWKWIDEIHEGWQQSNKKVDRYMAGTWGPTSSTIMMDRDDRRWIPDT